MKGLIAVLLSYGCLALVAAMIFTTGPAYAAPADATTSPAEAHLNAVNENSASA